MRFATERTLPATWPAPGSTIAVRSPRPFGLDGLDQPPPGEVVILSQITNAGNTLVAEPRQHLGAECA